MKVFKPTMLDLSNPIPKQITAAFDTTDLTSGWTPKSTDRIYLFHSDDDKLVPPLNTVKMVEHLTTNNSLKLKELEAYSFECCKKLSSLKINIYYQLLQNQLYPFLQLLPSDFELFVLIFFLTFQYFFLVDQHDFELFQLLIVHH